MTLRIMVDLETLSSKSNAVIVSIGAVPFDPETGVDVGRPFYEVLARGDQTGYGRHIDPSTIDWWLQQSEAARAVFKAPATSSPELALGRFSHYVFHLAELAGLKPEDAQVWGYGSTFDNVVLRSLYQDVGLKAPWSYRCDRCHRTLMSIANGLVEMPAREGTYHNALDDAIYQAKCAVVALKRFGVK